MTTASALANSSHGGFTGDVQLDINAKISTSRSESVNQIGSTINTGGNLLIKSGNTAKIEGSNVVSKSDITLDAQNVQIIAAQNTTMSNYDEKHGHLNVTIDMGGGGGFSLDAGLSGTRSDSSTNVNSHLSGNNITIKSTKDTTISGGVVKADNNLALNVGGNLLVESLQDTSTSSSHSYGLSAGYSDGNANFGGNFSTSESKSKWVKEQTSLTGSNVNIYVENKTTLKGAVIASTTNDPANLKLDTGSFEYVNIKDKSTTFSLGGSASFGTNALGNTEERNNTFSEGMNYGYSDKRQTNLATIGEGTIIVRDGKGDLTKLNRDVSVSQHQFFDSGFSGSATVDSTLLNVIAHPIVSAEKLEKGYDALKADVASAIQTGENLYQRTGNLIGGDGFYTDKGVQINICSEMWVDGTMKQSIVDSMDGRNILKLVDNSANGYEKTIYSFNATGDLTSAISQSYTNDNGITKLYSESDNKFGDTNTLELKYYDASGNKVYITDRYTQNPELGDSALQNRTVLTLDANGNAFDQETKMNQSPWGTKEMNGSGKDY